MNEASFYESRLKSVHNLLNACDADGILFTSLENIRYLSGFTGSDGAVVVTSPRSFFLTDSRYWTQAEAEIKGSEIVHYRKKMDGIASLLSDLKLKKIGFESPALTVALHRSLAEKLGSDVRLLPFEDEIKNLRAVKDPGELGLLRKAAEIASGALDHALTITREGMDPEYAGPTCLTCHGGPKGERDITGTKKEGWKEGDLAGAISVVVPMR